MLIEIIKTIKSNLLDNQDSYNIDKQEEDVFEGEEQNLISNDNINEPVVTFGLLNKLNLDFTMKNQQSNIK
ncbi:hypothetical protein C1645_816115 [Glomus cerebriforme]|uniref:Uncharacterized protein n=1 Tax=Glomus cerebriforme TaxID=658196 RepID=A0A397TC41_9GLOM|nr:hypothetical protein C1645_816115 [Glomus cerebriforme]